MRELALNYAARLAFGGALGLSAIGCGDSTGTGGEAGETESSSTGSDPDTNTNSNSDPTDASQSVTDSVDDSGTSSDTSATTTVSVTDTESATSTETSTNTSTGSSSATDTDSATTTGASASDTEGDTDPSGKTDSATTTGTISDSASATDSSATDSSASDPSTTDPSATDASATDPSATDPSATSTSTDGTTNDDSASDSASDTDGTTGGEECVIAPCGNHLYECGDCEDNDGDVGVDGLDVECVSPCDDDESSFATGIPGDNADPCNQDCFFDGNSGAGDDGCEWNLACDPQNPGGLDCPYDPSETNCPIGQDPDCVDNCEVPNGCDCFGCCSVTVDGIDYEIFIGDDCELDDIENCATCTQQATCGDPCSPDDCELCFGETELPPNCSEPNCAIGQQSCIVNGDCAEGDYCQTGCCVAVPS